MTTVTDDATRHPTMLSRSYRTVRLAGRSLAYCAALIPVAVIALVAAPLGGADAAAAGGGPCAPGCSERRRSPAPDGDRARWPSPATRC